MQLTPVESTTLAAVGYDEGRQLLVLEFRSHAIYHYFGVPAAVHQTLLRASSKGSYFNGFIRDRYPYALQRKGDQGAQALSAGRGR